MPRFVEFETVGHGLLPVNADQVAYVRRGVNGNTQLVFGAMQGGLHTLEVGGTVDEAVARLEGEVSPFPAAPVYKPSQFRRSRAKAPKPA